MPFTDFSGVLKTNRRTISQGAVSAAGSASIGPAPPYSSNISNYSYSAVPPSSDTETAPLIPKKNQRELGGKKQLSLSVTFVVLCSFAVCLVAILVTYGKDRRSPDAREHILKKWELEWSEHDERARMYKEEEERWAERRIEQDELIRDWDREREAYDREDRKREARWKREQIAHDKLLREELERHREAHDREKKEREEQEEEERRRLKMVWVDVEPQGCTTYATREYTATLANVPSNYPRGVEACKVTPLIVHGLSYLPHTCKDDGPGGIIGSWRVNHGQPDCTTFWADYKDKGCTSVGSGRRHIEHRLANLSPDGDWREFVATTPVRFNGLQFVGAEEAFKSYWGVFGLWEIDDAEC
ncbi:hypothetical protein BU15DRAFT_77659 [Melanogaster broomeanus]|nr:hypothetical protein BU15DRAFT_77659 [Melanogaster broomeanus]